MEFSEQLKTLAGRAEQLKNTLTTEEATKTSLVLPFFQLLGYDIFNPQEFIPEYTADTGTKKGEKVDYAILQNNVPIMIVEVKSLNTELSVKHINQLFRYFTVTQARFGILTNGYVYRFFSDLEDTNKMDLAPFLEINLLQLKPDDITELKKFQKQQFDMKEILDSASELKYTSLLKKALAEQFQEPSDQFVRALIKNIYPGVKTQAILEKFRALTLTAMNEYINDILNDKFQTAISSELPLEKTVEIQPMAHTYEFLQEELETLDYVKKLLKAENVSYKKTSRYAYMYISGNQSKWICRIYIYQEKEEKRLFVLHPYEGFREETEYYFDDPNQLSQIAELIIDIYNHHLRVV